MQTDVDAPLGRGIAAAAAFDERSGTIRALLVTVIESDPWEG